MHVLLVVIFVLAAGAFWWYRLRKITDARSKLLDAAGHFNVKAKRTNLRQKAEESPIAAIDDPVTAASTLIINLVKSHPMPPETEDIVRIQLNKITDGEQLDEAVTYGRWVQSLTMDRRGLRLNSLDRRKANGMLCEQLKTWLNHDERGELVSMIKSLDSDAAINLHSDYTKTAIRKLSA